MVYEVSWFDFYWGIKDSTNVFPILILSQCEFTERIDIIFVVAHEKYIFMMMECFWFDREWKHFIITCS